MIKAASTVPQMPSPADAHSSVATPSAVEIFIPTPLRDRCSGRSEIWVTATTVRAALEVLENDYPALHGCICDETGAVRRHVNLFVNKEHIRALAGLDTRLEPGHRIFIMTAVSGG